VVGLEHLLLFEKHAHKPVSNAPHSKQLVSAALLLCKTQLGSEVGNASVPLSLFWCTRRSASAVRALRFGGSAVNEQFWTNRSRIDVGIAGMSPPRPALLFVSNWTSFVSLSSAGSVPVSWLL